MIFFNKISSLWVYVEYNLNKKFALVYIKMVELKWIIICILGSLLDFFIFDSLKRMMIKGLRMII